MNYSQMKNKQMKAKAFIYALALLSSVASAKDQFACDNHFGENVEIVTDQVSINPNETIASLEGDFNGDGLKDKIVVLKVGRASRFDKGITLLKPLTWPHDKKQDIKFFSTDNTPYPSEDILGIGVIQSNTSVKGCQKYVIYNTILASEAKHLFVGVLRAQDDWYQFYQKIPQPN